MPATLTGLQFAGDTQVLSDPVPASGTLSLAQAFTTNNTAGNVIIVAVFGYNYGDGFWGFGNYQVTDTQGNSYTRLLNAPGGGIANGPGVGLFIATNIKAGANTVTGSFDWTRDTHDGGDFVQVVMIAEYHLPTPAVQAVNNYQVYGVGGLTPVTIDITDSHGATVGLTFSDTSPPYGPGTISNGVVLDVLSGGVDYLIAIYFGNDDNLEAPPTTTPSGYTTFQQELTIGPVTGASLTAYGHWYDPGSITLTLAIGANTLSLAYLCTDFNQGALYASGGTPPYTFSITAGALPPGLSLDATTGVISGTTQDQPGTYNFTATVTDSVSATDSIALSITLADEYGITDPQIILEVSNDGGKTWSAGRSRSLGKIGEYRKLVRWSRLGRSNNRVFRVICSDPVDVAWIAADLDVE